MAQDAQQLLAAALQLSETERCNLAAHLIDSLEPAAEDDTPSTWAAEIQERLEDIRSGKARPIPWPEARRMILDDTDPPPMIDFHPRAVTEARAARRWYARRSAALANRFFDELDRAVTDIASSPQLWPPHLHGTRCRRLARFPYLVVFTETGGDVLILAVAHTKRKPGYWKRRLP